MVWEGGGAGAQTGNGGNGRMKMNIGHWPRMAQAVHAAAEELNEQYGEEGIPSGVLKRRIEQIGGYGFDSVIPSDYCYNVINKAPYSFQYLLLVHVMRGRY